MKSRSMGVMPRHFLAAFSLLWVFGATLAYSQILVRPQYDNSMTKKTIETVLKEQTDNLMSLPGVVGTAQSLCAGKPCIKVFVVKKTAALERQIPSSIEGYLVEIQETGEIKALDRK